jgi:hypothetical protein
LAPQQSKEGQHDDQEAGKNVDPQPEFPRRARSSPNIPKVHASTTSTTALQCRLTAIAPYRADELKIRILAGSFDEYRQTRRTVIDFYHTVPWRTFEARQYWQLFAV